MSGTFKTSESTSWHEGPFTLHLFILKSIREVLVVGHRQAVAWIDDWHGMTIEDVREYEKTMQDETNERMRDLKLARSVSVVDGVSSPPEEGSTSSPAGGATTPTTPTVKKGWFSWS